ncbi:hypothetical protein ONE63_002702 [Megalurothrips usitatus]|uniref:Uncharacterized protein n=1 Tax=Megalurothrips usitatus TaxID=439358 RepID=A0AAV7X8X8_9NEOP|nr:hypothetical protein ONE63_002702 [Megalurothrips usitatus]
MQLLALNALLMFDVVFVFFLFLVGVSCLAYYLPATTRRSSLRHRYRYHQQYDPEPYPPCPPSPTFPPSPRHYVTDPNARPTQSPVDQDTLARKDGGGAIQCLPHDARESLLLVGETGTGTRVK